MSTPNFDLIENSLVLINGAYVLRSTLDDNAGSGNINTFLKLKMSPIEAWANIFNPIKLRDIPSLEIAGETFREIRLDLNEQNSQSQITLADFKIFKLFEQQPIFDLGGSVLMDARFQPRSSSADTLFYIPETAFSGLSGGSNLYLYAKLENSDGGFEEFSVADIASVNSSLFALNGQVFEDINGDGDNESGGDPGLSDVTVNLLLDNVTEFLIPLMIRLFPQQ